MQSCTYWLCIRIVPSVPGYPVHRQNWNYKRSSIILIIMTTSKYFLQGYKCCCTVIKLYVVAVQLSWKIVPVNNTNTQFLFHVNISPHNSSVLRGLETTCLAFTLPKIHFASQVGKMSSHTTGIGKRGPSTYRADVLTIALWCSPQRHKHDISQTCLH